MKKEIETLEKKIKGKMLGIKEGTLTPLSSGIGKTFKLLKKRDEASYEVLLEEYKEVLASLKK